MTCRKEKIKKIEKNKIENKIILENLKSCCYIGPVEQYFNYAPIKRPPVLLIHPYFIKKFKSLILDFLERIEDPLLKRYLCLDKGGTFLYFLNKLPEGEDVEKEFFEKFESLLKKALSNKENEIPLIPMFSLRFYLTRAESYSKDVLHHIIEHLWFKKRHLFVDRIGHTFMDLRDNPSLREELKRYLEEGIKQLLSLDLNNLRIDLKLDGILYLNGSLYVGKNHIMNFSLSAYEGEVPPIPKEVEHAKTSLKLLDYIPSWFDDERPDVLLAKYIDLISKDLDLNKIEEFDFIHYLFEELRHPFWVKEGGKGTLFDFKEYLKKLLSYELGIEIPKVDAELLLVFSSYFFVRHYLNSDNKKELILRTYQQRKEIIDIVFLKSSDKELQRFFLLGENEKLDKFLEKFLKKEDPLTSIKKLKTLARLRE